MKLHHLIVLLAAAALFVGCDNADSQQPTSAAPNSHDDHGHSHADGEDHPHDEPAEEVHSHHDDEVALGTFDIDGISVEAAQGHGQVEAGKEGHLVLKLPYNDKGATVVRAWIGTEDRTMSTVGKGEYAPSHDDYDIHAVAPTPLPDGAMWWVEIEKPDGTQAVGSLPFK